MAEKKSKNLNRYELMVIFKPLLPDDVRKGSHQSIVDMVEKSGGEVKNADVWGKRYLAYKIAGHEEGYYIVYDITLSPEDVKSIEVSISRISEILRHMVTRIDNPVEVGSKLNKKQIEI